jgi:hypothetical protein
MHDLERQSRCTADFTPDLLISAAEGVAEVIMLFPECSMPGHVTIRLMHLVGGIRTNVEVSCVCN